jgi:uncharacterized membrane protein YhaH (DUF805 family)
LAGRDELALIAELGAAYAGFLAIFLIFARREGRFSPSDGLAVRSMILGSFSTIFLALVPLAIGTFGIAEQIVWRASSTFGLLVLLSVGANISLASRRLSPEDRTELGSTAPMVAWALTALIAILFLSNVFAVLGPPSAGLHIAALVALLGITTLNFADIAFKRLI